MKLPPKNFSNSGIGSVLDRPPDAHLAFYKCRPCAGADAWIAWASLVPMTPASAVLEPAEPLWFDFGATEAEAISKVQREVEREVGAHGVAKAGGVSVALGEKAKPLLSEKE